LRGPEESSAHAEQSPSEDIEAAHVSVYGCEERNGVDAVAETTETEGEFDAEAVDEGAGEETDDGEGRVEGYVLFFDLSIRVDFCDFGMVVDETNHVIC
jgi:hypothetical protein